MPIPAGRNRWHGVSRADRRRRRRLSVHGADRPDHESDEAVQQKIYEYAQAIRKFIIKQTPGSDVRVMTDREALAGDLSGSTLRVYGTPEDNLWLARHWPELPVVIEPNHITTYRVHQGSDLRFITA